MSSSILAIDASNLIFRTYAAEPELTDEAFIRSLQRRVDAAKRQTGSGRVVAALDARINWRKREYEAYKEGRTPKPPRLRELMDRACELLGYAGVRSFQGEDFEADDVLATMAHKNPGETVIMTTDRDLYGTVNDRVRVLNMKGQLLGPDEVLAAFGTTPAAVPLHRALCGDSSDNLRGVPGVGDIRARLVCMVATTPDEAIYHAVRHAFPASVNAALREHEADMKRWYRLASLRVGEIYEVRA